MHEVDYQSQLLCRRIQSPYIYGTCLTSHVEQNRGYLFRHDSRCIDVMPYLHNYKGVSGVCTHTTQTPSLGR